jgi:hypothetical protein
MSYANELIEQLAVYIAANEDWMTDVEKGKIVASFNNRITNLGNVTLSQLIDSL